VNQLGYFGKTRHRGDFVRFNLPQSFTKVWDDWLQQLILDGEQHHQNEWKSLYDNAPAHRFVLSAGIAGSQMWLGMLLPSQDKVGRRFPFCLAMSLPEENLPCVTASRMTPWFCDAQNLLARMQTSDFDFDQLQAELGKLADKYEQSVTSSVPPITTIPNLYSDTVGVTIDSADPLNNPLATQALLDGVLTQTLGEYSLWMCQDGSNQSLLHSGLPIGQSALAMFRGDMQTCAPTRVDLASLGFSTIAAASTQIHLNHEDHEQHTSAGEDHLMGAAIAGVHGDSLMDNAEHASDTTQANAKPEAQSSISIETQDDLNATDEYQPLDTSTVEQITSADDWAALDEFKVADDEHIKVTIPEVEPLELDEDDSADTEDAPWET
jgi:type VI secretion system protein ImpM